MPNIDHSIWFRRTYYQETLKVYTKVWDLYVKFYTVFLTANVLGIGIVIEHGGGKRGPIAIAFIFSNIITIITSYGVSQYSLKTNETLVEVAKYFLGNEQNDPVAKSSPVAMPISEWAGYGNCFACLCHIGIWIAVWHMG